MKHLKLVNENYFKHMLEAFAASFIFILAGVICFVHSIFPFIFQTTSSNMVKSVIIKINKRQSTDE